MLSKKIEDALNDQINAEFYSAYLYLSMEAYFESVNLPGFANWMRVQTQEELTHAMKIYDFVNERGANDIVQKLKLMADAPGGMYMIEQELGQRVFTPPAAEGV